MCLIVQLLLFPVIVSFLYQLCGFEQLSIKYLYSRSRCDYCHRSLSTIELIPIISYLIQKGRSRCCHQKLSMLYPLGEIISLSAIPLLNMSLPITSELFLLLFFLLLTLSIFDMATLSIPLHMMIIFSCCCYFYSDIHLTHAFFMIIGLHLFYFCSRRAMGYGDILVFSMLACFLPIIVFIYVFLFTFIIGGIVMLSIMLYKRQRLTHHVPLVPFIFLSFCFVISQYASLHQGGLFI